MWLQTLILKKNYDIVVVLLELVTKLSIFSSSGWSFPAITSDCRGFPMSDVIIVLRGAWHTAWVSVPALATPIHNVLSEKSARERIHLQHMRTQNVFM